MKAFDILVNRNKGEKFKKKKEELPNIKPLYEDMCRIVPPVVANNFDVFILLQKPKKLCEQHPYTYADKLIKKIICNKTNIII